MNWSFLKSSVKSIILIKNISIAIMLQIAEDLTEHNFICPCNKFTVAFVCLYFIMPAFALIALTLSLEQQNGKTWKVVFAGSLPSFLLARDSSD